jgi:hypothetical protein
MECCYVGCLGSWLGLQSALKAGMALLSLLPWLVLLQVILDNRLQAARLATNRDRSAHSRYSSRNHSHSNSRRIQQLASLEVVWWGCLSQAGWQS